MQENLSYVPENNTTDLAQTSAANKHKHEKETATAGNVTVLFCHKVRFIMIVWKGD